MIAFLVCLFCFHSSWSQRDVPVSRDSLKTVLLGLKAQSKTENVDSALALIDFYEFHNPTLESPLHGELVIADALKRIEKTQAKQERRARAFTSTPSWSSNPNVVEAKGVEEKGLPAVERAFDDGNAEKEASKEGNLTDEAVPVVKEVWRAKPIVKEEEVSEEGNLTDEAVPVVKEVWKAEPIVKSQLDSGLWLTSQTDSRILHSKLVKVQNLLRQSRNAMRVAFISLVIPPAALVIFPVAGIVAMSKRNAAYRALMSVQ